MKSSEVARTQAVDDLCAVLTAAHLDDRDAMDGLLKSIRGDRARERLLTAAAVGTLVSLYESTGKPWPHAIRHLRRNEGMA